MTMPWLAAVGMGAGDGSGLAALVVSGAHAVVRTAQGAAPVGLAALGATGVLWRSRRRMEALQAARRLEATLRREMLAYLLLEIPEDCLRCATFAKAACRLISVRSAFQSAAIVRVDGEGRLRVTGSVGMGDLSLQALQRWSAGELAEKLREAPKEGEHGRRLLLERRRPGEGEEAARMRCEEVIVLPMQQAFPRQQALPRQHAQGLEGVLVVGLPTRSGAGRRERCSTGGARAERLEALEALALRMLLQATRSDSAVERPRRAAGVQGAGRVGTDKGERARTSHRRTLDTVAPGDGSPRREATLRRLIEATAPPGFALPVRTPDRVRGYCPTRL